MTAAPQPDAPRTGPSETQSAADRAWERECGHVKLTQYQMRLLRQGFEAGYAAGTAAERERTEHTVCLCDVDAEALRAAISAVIGGSPHAALEWGYELLTVATAEARS